jgi:hypothetical protein
MIFIVYNLFYCSWWPHFFLAKKISATLDPKWVSGRAMWGLSFSNMLCNVMHVSTAWTIIQLAQSTYKSFDWRRRNACLLGMRPDYCVCCMSSTSCKTPLVWSFDTSNNWCETLKICINWNINVILLGIHWDMKLIICVSTLCKLKYV